MIEKSKESFLAILTSLWLRLSTVAIIALLFFLTLQLPERVVGWSFYLRPADEFFEVAAYAIFVALIGVALGALISAAVAPFLLYRAAESRRQLVETVTQMAVAVAAFLDLAIALAALLKWANLYGIVKDALFACYIIGFVLALCIPKRRKQVVTSLDSFLGEQTTRRAVIGTGAAAAALVAGEALLGKTAYAAGAPKSAARPSGPNILLVTFDALSAEDLSLYGYRLPTTPHIDAFARKSSVFTNFYSASTFTTPSVATMLTGLEPSEHHVYSLNGTFRDAVAARTLPRLMRQAGYSTGASITNPVAYFLAQSIATDFDALPYPACRTKDLMPIWGATRILHQRQPLGSRADEFSDIEKTLDYVPRDLLEHYSPRLFAETKSGYPPAGSFRQAREILQGMPERFFLWVHLLAPHWPYLPDRENVGRFLPSNEVRTIEEQMNSHARLIQKLRLRYDEFIADADSAFGGFLTDLEGSQRLQNTAVIVSADHGESFEGGFYGHGSPYQTRPIVHIPLMIHLPGQQNGSRIGVTMDQTSLAPSILEIAGVPRGDWMRGPSLLPWLNRDNQGAGEGLAFAQYLETDSIFRPVSNGTVGVIDGRHQYVLDLATGKGILRGLDEAQMKDLDRSADNPALAQTMRDAIYARFPDLPRRAV